MSIIADTLKRLQAQSEDPSPKPQENLSARPTFNKGEGSGRHRKDSPFGFLIMMVGMTITLGGFAAASFWIGGHLDFGVAPGTQARIPDRRSLPITSHVSEDLTPLEQSSKSIAATRDEPIQFSNISKNPDKNDQPSTSISMDTGSSTAPLSRLHEETMPSSSKIEMDNSLSAQTLMPTSPDQERFSGRINQSITLHEELTTPPQANSQEPSSLIASSKLHESTTERLDTDSDVTDQADKSAVSNVIADHPVRSEDSNLMAMSLEEEIIETENFVNTSGASADPDHGPTNLTALKARLEAFDPIHKAANPLQPSPANRLRHAQQLIQAGNYEDAVTLLSPLFHDPPIKWQPWFWMGTALLGKGEMEQADQFFLSGLARNDKVPQLWIQRALVAEQRGDYQIAIHELRQAESLESNLPHIHLNMGYAYEQLGNDRMANQYYEKFLKFSEGNPIFFSTRKKLFARVTQQTATEKTLPSSLPSLFPNP